MLVVGFCVSDVYFLLFMVSLIVTTSAIDCLETLVFEMTCYVECDVKL